MFLGTHQHALDDKGRVSIPARYRELLAAEPEPGLILTIHSGDAGQCLVAYPRAPFFRLAQQLVTDGPTDPRLERYARAILPTATEALSRAGESFARLGISVCLPSTEVGKPPEPLPSRIHELQRAIRESGYHVCIETARLKTAFYKEHGFDGPVSVRRASALRYVLNNKTVMVHPNELLVGNFTSKRVGGNVWVEYFAATMAVHFWRIDRQKPVAFKCSAADKARFLDACPHLLDDVQAIDKALGREPRMDWRATWDEIEALLKED